MVAKAKEGGGTKTRRGFGWISSWERCILATAMNIPPENIVADAAWFYLKRPESRGRVSICLGNRTMKQGRGKYGVRYVARPFSNFTGQGIWISQ